MPVRKFTQSQLPQLLEFVQVHRSWRGRSRDLGRRIFQDTLKQPGLAPEDNCLVLEEEGQVQGFCLITPELPIGRAVLELEVARHLEETSVTAEAVRRSVDRAREMGVQVVHMCVADNSPRPKWLKAQGFAQVRTFWDMVWRQEKLPEVAVPPDFGVRPFQPGDAALLAQVQNAAFEGSWGFCPNTAEQIEYRTSMANTSRRGIFFLRQGDKTAGYCWTCVAPLEGGTRGVIGMIGVVPGYRGQGIGQVILLAGMEYLRSSGVADIALQVDGANTPAIRLYTSVGFERSGERHWFERDLSSAAPVAATAPAIR